MGNSYFPTNDAEFSSWVDNFGAYLTTHWEHFGLTVDELGVFDSVHPMWDGDLAAHMTAMANAKSMCAAKNARREEFCGMIRGLVGRINAWPETTDADREALGLKSSSPAPSPSPNPDMTDERPLAIVDISARLRHVMRLQTITNTGTKKARPAGSMGAELWRKVGTAPSGTSDLEYVGIVKKTPYLLQYSDTDAGKQAHYALRWINSKGEPGSWSETESVTIAA